MTREVEEKAQEEKAQCFEGKPAGFDAQVRDAQKDGLPWATGDSMLGLTSGIDFGWD
jgi:hypothetical protein